MRKNIIQLKTEPNKNDIWLSEEGLKKYGKNGWELLGGKTSSSGYDDTEIKAQIKENANNIAANKADADAKLSNLETKLIMQFRRLQ